MTLGTHVHSQELVEKLTVKIKEVEAVKAPEWAAFVKTGMSKERPPMDGDWWEKRAASILFKVLRYGPIGVSKLRRKYGGKKNRGVKPGRFYPGSANIIRKILQQLEKAELVKMKDKGVRKGKVIAPKGAALIHSAAKGLIPAEVLEQMKKEVEKKAEKKTEVRKKRIPKKEPKRDRKEDKK